MPFQQHGKLCGLWQKGDLLFSEVLEEGPVVSIKCQTVSPSRYSGHPELTEELHVTYRTVVCSVYGFVLGNTLRACRNQLARVQANCSDTIVAPPLSLHKWSLSDQDNMLDCAVGLLQCPSVFSHLHITSGYSMNLHLCHSTSGVSLTRTTCWTVQLGCSSVSLRFLPPPHHLWLHNECVFTVQANCSDTIVAPPLSLHKWSLPDQDNMLDCAVGLPQCPSAFSHLHIASVCGGFGTWYRPSPPQSSLVVAAGNKPFVGFHYIVEGSNAPVLTDVVKAVGTKLKSALNQAVPSWFLGGRKPNPPPEKEKVIIEPAEPMSCRFGLCDLWRQGTSVTMSPHRNLCVVSDSLGRVTLIDNSTGLALRMWKGYRDAQCGWLTAEEEQSKGRKRLALFLVIYAPKKGIVEVWAMQQGPRIATFTASKNGRLFYIGHGLLGVSSVGNRNPNRSATPCVFVDECGVLTEISIPFHCALSDKNSKRARDIHLVRKLRQLLKTGDGEQTADSVTTLCRELQTHTVRAQALDLLTSSRRVAANTLLEVVEGFLHTLECVDDENVDTGKKSLMQRCVKLQKLLIFFMFCSGLQQKPPDYDTVMTADSNSDLDNLSELLRLSKDETLRLVQPPEDGMERVRVKFQEGLEGLPSYLAGFQTNATSDDTIHLVDTSVNQNLTHISEVVCGGVQGNVADWTNAAAESGIDSLALLRLSLISWLSRRSLPSLADTLTFSQLVTSVCNIAGNRVQEPAWWGEVRSMLRDSVSPHLAVVAAAVCKAVALTLEETAMMTASAGTDDSETKSSDWEKVTQESCTWSLLISQLEDVALISSVLRHKPVCSKTPTLYCLPYDPPELSLQNVCSKGRGCVSELVARWVASGGLEPTLLLETSRVSSCSPESERSGSAGVGVVEGQTLSAECGEEARPTSDDQ
ncbi:Rab3 GTPase-activating protein non-catalytic subunit, partial [Homalodisca vitripennis]